MANPKKAESKPDLNIYQLLNPLFLWTLFQGLTPFSPKRSGFKRSRLHLCMCLISILVYTAISVKTIYDKRFDTIDGFIYNITERLELYTTNVNMVIAVLFACLQRNKILEVIERMHKMDLRIKHLFPHAEFKNSNTALKLYAILFLVSLYIIASFAMDMIVFWDTDFLTSAKLAYSFMCPKLICTHVVIQFCVLTNILHKRFMILNSNLEALTATSHEHIDFILKDISGLNIISSHRILEIVESIRLKHYALCDIAALLNSAYGTQILFTALQVFVTLLSSIFYCIRTVGLRPETLEFNPTVLVVYTMNVVFLSFAQLWGCVVYASNANFEARKTGSIVHKFRTDKLTTQLEFELVYFSLQLKQHNVNFNACRIFMLDESLLLSVVGVICTYLVIVIQFEFTALNALIKDD